MKITNGIHFSKLITSYRTLNQTRRAQEYAFHKASQVFKLQLSDEELMTAYDEIYTIEYNKFLNLQYKPELLV
jgi:hypothetical protein